MNVLIYSGPEVVQSSLTTLTSTLRSLLLPNYTVQSITQHTLINHPWTVSCALLVIPSFSSTTSGSDLTNGVSRFVNGGGSVLAFSVGAKGRTKDALTLPASYDIGLSGPSASLDLPDYVLVDFASPSKSGLSGSGGVETVIVEGSTGDVLTSVQSAVPCPLFANLADRSNVRVLGKFGGGEVAGISLSFSSSGSGRAVLWAPRLDQPLVTVSSPDPEEEPRRLGLMRTSLRECGLQLLSTGTAASRLPTPMFFVGAAPIVDTILSRLSVDFTQGPTKELKDQNDTFVIHPSSDATTDLPESDATTFQPKRIIALTNGAFPPREKTPTFDVALYLGELAKRKQRGDVNDNSDPWPIGAALMYGEVITSTQTMLDRFVFLYKPTCIFYSLIAQRYRNPKLLANLPSPLLCLASYQLQGRGRGANMWLSPDGCLQFSLALRIPIAKIPMNKLVFLQYLFSLAIVEACRDEAVLGSYGEAVKIKWPNDIYTVLGEGKNRELKKIGGVLVNIGITDKDSHVVIGRPFATPVFAC
jgi:biotin---protein ligase